MGACNFPSLDYLRGCVAFSFSLPSGSIFVKVWAAEAALTKLLASDAWVIRRKLEASSVLLAALCRFA